MPSTSILLSLQQQQQHQQHQQHQQQQQGSSPKKKPQAPLLQRFYQELQASGVHIHHDVVGANGELSEEQPTPNDTHAGSTTPLLDLDNPAFSTITSVQHAKYIKLVLRQDAHYQQQQQQQPQQQRRRTPAEKRFLQFLSPILRKEQQAYQQAVRRLWEESQNTRLIVSPALLGVSQWACQEHKRINDQRWGPDPPPLTFGRCLQTISLMQGMPQLDVQNLDIQPIWTDTRDDKDSGSFTLPQVGDKVLRSPKQTLFPVDHSMIHQDKKLLELAAQTQADIVTTHEVLETLLRLPEDFATRWTALATPTSLESSSRTYPSVVLLETIQQVFPSPRECLTYGLQEAMAQQAQQGDASSFRFSYSLWTLPALPHDRRKGKSTVRVLIRTTQRLWKESTTMENPATTMPLTDSNVVIRAHVEYFPERGLEVLSSYERSLWILDQLVGSTTKVARVDATTGRILQWQDGSVAHAFAQEGSVYASPNFSTSKHDSATKNTLMQGWGHVQLLLQTIPSIVPEADPASATEDQQQRLLQPSQRLLHLPGPQSSVSIHAPKGTQDVSTPTTLDLQPLLANANGVWMHPEALQSCVCPWMWDIRDRIPNTFPFAE
eukprot:Nitzschia sp. Nitz4//scaffold68_size99682//16776//18593//NITZ4_004554-RA/size99682-processed-gene-0.35-mRNA-1//-1//CDS//3329556563//5427//frame0